MRPRLDPDKPLPPGAMEFEFGVPVPGVILPPERWTTSALRSWPQTGVLDWPAVFGRSAPVVLDLGCGNGRSVLVSATRRPECDHLGVDSLPVVIRYARKRARQRGLGNVRFAVGDAFDTVARRVGAGTVAQVHVYHPQPYYEASQAHRRLITPLFLFHVHRVLMDGGRLVLQTDNPAYWAYMRQVAPAFFDFREQLAPWPEAPEGITRREIIARLRGLPIFRGVGIARSDVDPQPARKLAEQLPPPAFKADRRLMELDEIDRSGQLPVRWRKKLPPGRGRQGG